MLIGVLPTVVSPGAIWAEVEPGFHIELETAIWGYKRRAAIRPNKKTPASADEFPFLLLALALSEFSRSTAQCFPSLRGRKRPVLPVWGNSPAVQLGALPRAEAYAPFRSPYF